MDQETREAVRVMEKQLGLPTGFFVRLHDEDDWSFVIKLHALMEAAVTYLLAEHFGDQRLGKFFDRLEMSNPRVGKLALLNELDLLPSEARTFLQKLSELRNNRVHDIREVGFDLERYILSLPSGKVKAFVNQLSPKRLVGATPKRPNPSVEELREFFSKNLKILMMQFAAMILELVHLKRQGSVIKRTGLSRVSSATRSLMS